jgi:Mg2+ and Co2+ transporter CorA
MLFLMKIHWYLLDSGRLQEQPAPTGWPDGNLGAPGESWFDIEEAEPEELRLFLAPLNLHPLLLERCAAPANTPGVVSYDRAVLLEFPVSLEQEAPAPAFLLFLLQAPVLVTIRPCPLPALDDVIRGLAANREADLHHLAHIVYEILDALADLNVEAQIEVRDRILRMAQALSKDPGKVSPGDLAALRWQVERLVSLIENQLYCVTNLNACDNEALQEPHRRAYIQDLVSEAQIAQQGVYRLEARVKDLYADYQMAGSDLVEKRLRILTIVSAITLPLGLIAGLLGMNVGGVPGTTAAYGFLVVVLLMVAIMALEFWYFRRKGWFD